MKFFLPFLLIVTTSTALAQENWATVVSFTGNGNTITKAFDIPVLEWKVKFQSWATDPQLDVLPDGAAHSISIMLKSPTDDTLKKLLSNQESRIYISNTTNMSQSGLFYFDIRNTNGKWEIEVQVPKIKNPDDTEIHNL